MAELQPKWWVAYYCPKRSERWVASEVYETETQAKAWLKPRRPKSEPLMYGVLQFDERDAAERFREDNEHDDD